MANATKATTALVAVALGLATVTAAFVTISSTASIAEAPVVKIQDRLLAEVRLISIDAAAEEQTEVRSNPVEAVTVATRIVPLPPKAPRSAALLETIRLPQPKPVEIAVLGSDSVPLPRPRPDAEMIVGSLSAAEQRATR